MLLRNVEVGARRVDVRVADGRIAEVGAALPGRATIDGGGSSALIPGLHDHHVHLLATAAARVSVAAGPPHVRTAAELRAALAGAVAVQGWVRAVDYDEAVAGHLDRADLDGLHGARPVRVQHRSGALWMVNSAGAEVLGLDHADLAGIERDARGRATGRLWRADAWLTERIGARAAPDLAGVGRQLAQAGVTGVTDATPSMTDDATALIAAARRDGLLPQRVTLLAADRDRVPNGLTLGPAKLVLADHDLPTMDEIAAHVERARAQGRAVAMHCVTRESLLLALTVLADVGAGSGDRIEHAAVAPPEAAALAASLGVVVVTQPSLVARRGDDYLDRVEHGDREYLWPWASLRNAGVPVAGSSDGPYGDLDPWAGIRAAVERTTPSGRIVGAHERVDPETALAGWLTAADAPGGPVRGVRPGEPADLILLDAPLVEVMADPHPRHVSLTMIGGEIVHQRRGEE